MPYIVEEKRQQIDREIDAIHQALVNLELDDDQNNMEGNMNYVITRLLMMVYGDKDSTSYSNVNDAIGLLECVKQEYYRKVAVPYETQKEFENGHIEPFKGHDPVITGAINIEIPPDAMSQVTQSLSDMIDKSEKKDE